jgi:WD40 repeat protein
VTTTNISMHEGDPSDLFDLRLIERQVSGERFVERAWLRDRIKAELADPGCRIVLVTGEPGAGKTNLLASLASHKPGWLRYFIRRIGEAEGDSHRHEGSLSSFLTIVGLQLAARRPDLFPDLNEVLAMEAEQTARRVAESGQMIGLSIAELVVHPFMRLAVDVRQQAEVIEGSVTAVQIGRLVAAASQYPEELAAPALFDPARRMAGQSANEQIVVLLDGLDELRFRDAGLDVGMWLTAQPALPANLRFVVSSRHDEPRLGELRRGHKAWLREVRINPCSEQVRHDTTCFAERIAADARINAVLASRGISSQRFVREAVGAAAGNFQYLAFLAKTLEAAAGDLPSASVRQPTTAAVDLEWLDNLQDLPAGLDELHGLFLERMRNRVAPASHGLPRWEALYRPLLGMLAVARAPLTSAQLEAFGNLPTQDEACTHALATLRQFLDLDPAGGYHLYHTTVAQFLVAEKTSSTDPHLYCRPKTWHRRITKHAVKRHHHDGSWKAADPYLRIHLAAHAAAIGRLDELLEDPRFLVAADPTGLLEEFGSVHRAAPITQIYRQVVSILRDDDEAGALAHLELYARRAGLDEFAERIAAVGNSRPWLFDWTHWQPVAIRQVLGEHDKEITAIAVTSAKRPMAISGSVDGKLRIWDLAAGTSAGSLSHTNDTWLKGVTVLATGELDSGEPIVVSGGEDGAIRAWSLATSRPIGAPLMGLENAGQAMAVGAIDGKPVAICRAGGSVRAWDLASQVSLGPPILAERPEVAAIGRHAGRTLLAVGDNAGPGREQAQVWDLATGHAVGGPLYPEEGWITAVALGDINGAPILALADGAYGVQVWDIATGEPRSHRPVNWNGGAAYALALCTLEDRQVLAVGDRAGRLWLWDFAANSLIGELVQAHPDGGVTALAIWESDGLLRLLSAGEEYDEGAGSPHPVLRFWAHADGQPSGLRPSGSAIRPEDAISGVAIATIDGDPAIMTTDGHKVLLRDPVTGQSLAAPLCGRQEKVSALAVANLDRKPVAIAAAGGTIRVWDIVAGVQALPPLTGNSDVGARLESSVAIGVCQVRGRPTIVSATWRTGTRLWDLASGEPAGVGLIREPEYVHSMAVGEIAGRPAVVFGTRDVQVLDLETGGAIDPPHPGHFGQVNAVAVARHHERTLVVSANADRTLRIWDPESPANPAPEMSSEDPSLLQIPDIVETLAIAEVDGRPVVVCGGRTKAVRVIDLATQSPGPLTGGATRSLAIGAVAGQPVVVCGAENGVHILDVATGVPAAPPPSVGRHLHPVAAVAVGELQGKQVGLCAVGSTVHAWHLDTGEPTDMRPIHHPQVGCLATGTLKGRPVVVSGGWDRSVRVSDLETGEPAHEPLTELDDPVTSVSITSLAGDEILIYMRPGDVRGYYLTSPEWMRLGSPMFPTDFSAVNESPPPPPRIGENLARGGSFGPRVTALGMVENIPIVVSGRDDGSIDMFTVDTALPIGAPLAGHSGPVTAVAYRDLAGGPIIASGGVDGTVRIWDPTDGSMILMIQTLAWVNAVALALPDRCIIGTDMGLIGVRLNLRDTPGVDAILSGQGERRRVVLPTDARGARVCPVHAEHARVCDFHRQKALRLCIKGIQLGNPKTQLLRYSQGHCYVLHDRLVICEAEPSSRGSGLVIPVNAIVIEPQDTPHAYQYDGCHFGIVIHGEGKYRTLACYTRADRDELVSVIHGLMR